MKSYSGPSLKASDNLSSLLQVGVCFQLTLDGNAHCLIRRGVVVAPQAPAPIWYDDGSFIGGFTTSAQKLFAVFDKVPPHLMSRVTVEPIPQNDLERWKKDRVLDCVKHSCGEPVCLRAPFKGKKRGRKPSSKPPKQKREMFPREESKGEDTLPVDYLESDFDDVIHVHAHAALTYELLLSLLRSTEQDILQRLTPTKIDVETQTEWSWMAAE